MIRFNYFLSILITSIAVFILVVCMLPSAGYSEDEVAPQVTADQAEDKPEFAYNPIGLRDPFAPLVNKIRKSITKPKRDLGPLEKFELSQFRLLALLIVGGEPRAMVKAPDGRSYTITVEPETRMGRNGGIVKRIEAKTYMVDEVTGQRIQKHPDRIVVEETSIDNFTGKELKNMSYIEM